MINPFKMMGDMNAMRKQALAIQAELEKEEFEVVVGEARVVINGNQRVKEVEISGQTDTDLLNAINQAIKKSQEAAAGKLSSLSKLMGQ